MCINISYFLRQIVFQISEFGVHLNHYPITDVTFFEVSKYNGEFDLMKNSIEKFSGNPLSSVFYTVNSRNVSKGNYDFAP